MSEVIRAIKQRPMVELALTVLAAIGIAYGVQRFVIKPYVIPSESMLQTLKVGDRIFAARFWYDIADPQRGEIVVLHPNGIGNDVKPSTQVASIVFVKRIVGLPGEWIRGHNHHVEICSGPTSGCRALLEPYLSSAQEPFPRDGSTAELIPAGSYFVMGDNRSFSDDSRVWGTVRRSQILGRVFGTYWPLSRIGSP